MTEPWHYTGGETNYLSRCRLCGHGCGANRLAGESGRCGAGAEAMAAAHLLHYGEEPPISGTRGSGTIFFCSCPLSCVFCQNHQISRENRGRTVTPTQLAEMMLELQDNGAHNLNLVSPTPWVVHIIESLRLAQTKGFHLPVVYNTGGFDSLSGLRLLEGMVDVYLPDAKYSQPEAAACYSGAENYVAVNRAALREMHRQAGHLEVDPEGLAVSGLLTRHLVLPGNLAGTDAVLRWLAAEFGPGLWLSLMAQYLPCHLAAPGKTSFPELARTLFYEEYEQAVDWAAALGLENVFVQEMAAAEIYAPDFNTREVFHRPG